MAVITIDGIKLDVPENKNVLDCALENGKIRRAHV